MNSRARFETIIDKLEIPAYPFAKKSQKDGVPLFKKLTTVISRDAGGLSFADLRAILKDEQDKPATPERGIKIMAMAQTLLIGTPQDFVRGADMYAGINDEVGDKNKARQKFESLYQVQTDLLTMHRDGPGAKISANLVALAEHTVKVATEMYRQFAAPKQQVALGDYDPYFRAQKFLRNVLAGSEQYSAPERGFRAETVREHSRPQA